jgi:FAD/FMN-containing dehydrogenase
MVLAVSIAPELQEPAQAALRALKEALAPWRTDEMPPTGLSAWESLQDSISEPDLARLREIKQRVDPLGVLGGNYPLV